MNLKIFLPMGEKPPDTFGRGCDASQSQAYIVITFPWFCQNLEEFLVFLSTVLSSFVCPLLVIFLDTSLPPPGVGYKIALQFSMPSLPAHMHQITTTNTTAHTTILLLLILLLLIIIVIRLLACLLSLSFMTPAFHHHQLLHFVLVVRW